MTNAFSITVATNTVRLDDDRQGKASFTVFNASGRALRARAQLVPDKPVAGAWLTVVGEAERDFNIAVAEHYMVRIELPAEAPAGSYLFRLDMVGREAPIEEYTEGPTVTFVAPEPEHEPQKKPFPWWIILVAVGVLAVIGIVLAVIFWPRNVSVPNVRGKTVEQATVELEEVGLVARATRVEESHDSVPKDMVIRTEPVADSEVRKGSGVRLVVSTGPPDVAVTVTFTEITIIDNAEPSGFSDVGEVWLSFVVNGNPGRWPVGGTRNVRDGDTHAIGAELRVVLERDEQLVISVNGIEEDTGPFDSNDNMGVVLKEYGGADRWGEGVHTERSSCPDGCYSISYTVSVDSR